MEEFLFQYNSSSPKRQVRSIKVQLLTASFGILIGYTENISFYDGAKIIILIVGLLIALLNIVFVVRYQKFTAKYGQKFEYIILLGDGIIMLTTGITYHLGDSNLIQYTYYFLALMYIIVLPYFLLPARRKRLYLKILSDGVQYRGYFRTVRLSWHDIASIHYQPGIIQLKKNGKKRAEKFYIEKTKDMYKVFEFIEDQKNKHHNRMLITFRGA